MLTDKLGLGAPSDIAARMPLTDSRGNVVLDKDGEEGWIEFWGPHARALKSTRRQFEIDAYLEYEKEKRRGAKPMSAAEADKKLEALKRKMVEAIALRVRAWRLVSIDGEVLPDPCTLENATALFSADGYEYLLDAAVEFTRDAENFTPANATS